MSVRTRLATLGPLLICLLSIAAIGSLQAQEGERRAPVPEFVGTHRDWNVYKFQDSDETICYMASEPKKQEGNYTRRGNPAVLVTRRPAPRVVYEVSVQPGYSYAEGSDVEVQIDRQKFLLFTRGEHAWAPREEDDQSLINAMKRGANMTVRGTSSRNTYSLDTYSLLGFTAAYQAMLDACSAASS
jgi:invasion protein IalB